VDAGALDMLHDAGDEAVHAVRDTVKLGLFAHDVAVDENRGFRRDIDRIAHVRAQLVLAVDDFHRPTAENIGRPHETGVADLARDLDRCLGCRDRTAFRLRNT